MEHEDHTQDQDQDVEEPLYQGLFEAAKSSGKNTSKLFEQLSPEQRADVLAFVEWLKTTDMTQNSVNSYKSYVTKAMLKTSGVIAEDLTSDERSGVRKFQAWHEARA